MHYYFKSSYLIVSLNFNSRHLYCVFCVSNHFSVVPLFHIPTWTECLHHNARSGEKLICSLAARPTRTPLSHYVFFPLSAQTELGQKLTLCSKVCFAIGGAPKEVAASATAFFLQIYLLDIAQVMCLRTERMRKCVAPVYE